MQSFDCELQFNSTGYTNDSVPFRCGFIYTYLMRMDFREHTFLVLNNSLLDVRRQFDAELTSSSFRRKFLIITVHD
jgi:hypothetical protein